jgi:hypothetical protein
MTAGVPQATGASLPAGLAPISFGAPVAVVALARDGTVGRAVP